MTLPENTIFYFDLSTKNVVSKKTIVKQVNKYIKVKEKESPESNWGTVVFQRGEDNPEFHDTLAEDEEELEPFLQDNLKFTDKAHPIEQGLMLASTYLVEAYRNGGSHVLRVIVISDGPSEDSNRDLVNALIDLLDNIKYFMFIDIIRVGDQRVYPDDVKLKMITDTTRGNVYYAASDESFKNIMDLIGQEKSLSKIKEYPVPEDKRPFFENLCWKLIDKGVGKVACIACNKDDDSLGTVFQCEKCGASYHESCAKELGLHEGDPLLGMFRCKKCHCLLLLSSIQNVTMQSRVSNKPLPAKGAAKATPSSSSRSMPSISRTRELDDDDDDIKVVSVEDVATEENKDKMLDHDKSGKSKVTQKKKK